MRFGRNQSVVKELQSRGGDEGESFLAENVMKMHHLSMRRRAPARLIEYCALIVLAGDECVNAHRVAAQGFSFLNAKTLM